MREQSTFNSFQCCHLIYDLMGNSTHVHTYAGSINENQVKTHAFVGVALFLFQNFFAYPLMTACDFTSAPS